MANKSEGVLLGTVKAIEELWVGTLQRAVKDRGLLGWYGRWMGMGMGLREMQLAWAEQMLAFWGVPTASQMREALGLMQRVEDRVLKLEDRVEELGLTGPEQGKARAEQPASGQEVRG